MKIAVARLRPRRHPSPGASPRGRGRAVGATLSPEIYQSGDQLEGKNE